MCEIAPRKKLNKRVRDTHSPARKSLPTAAMNPEKPTPNVAIERYQIGTWENCISKVITEEKLDLKDAIPILRDTTKPIVRNGEKVFPPYECVRANVCSGGHQSKCTQLCIRSQEFCFGCSIEKLKHTHHLQSALNDAIIRDNETIGSIDNGSHRASHAKYEGNSGALKPSVSAEFSRLVNIVGYCKSVHCRRRGTHALPAGDHCRYHCGNCLAVELDKTYANAELSTCAILFMPAVARDTLMGKPIITERSSIELRFEGGHAYVAHNEVEGFWLQIAPRDCVRESELFWRLPWMFVVTTPAYFKSKGRDPAIYMGLFRGHLKGRYVCHNIAIGQKCGSLNQQRVKEALMPFPALIMPPHYPIWVETGPTANYPGSLIIQHECGLCTRKTSTNNGIPDMTELLQRLHIEAMRDPAYSSADPEKRKQILSDKIQGVPQPRVIGFADDVFDLPTC